MPPLRLVKLTDADLTLSFAPPGLTQTAADTLGNDMTTADGFDQILQGIASAVSAEIPWVNWWGTFTDSADFPDGGVVAGLVGPLISDFALFAASGDAQSADLDMTLTGQSPAPVTPPTAPPPTAPVTTAPVHAGGGGGSPTGIPGTYQNVYGLNNGQLTVSVVYFPGTPGRYQLLPP